MNTISRVYAQIDLSAIRYNMESMHKNLAPDTKMAAVIKTNGYGHGALAVAREIEQLPYLWGFAVATTEEAVQLRQDGRTKPILILGISFLEHCRDIVAYDIRPAVCDFKTAKNLSDCAVQMGKECHIHLAIDTGMSRIGLQVDEKTVQIVEQIAALPNIHIEGIFTHFARADELSKEATFEQVEKFKDMVRILSEHNIHIPIRHCSNSAGIIELPEVHMDMVRAGITLYGLWPSEEVARDIVPIKPAMSLHSHVSFVKELEAGRQISYGGIYTTTRREIIATVPVGYGDGYARSLSNRGYVLIHGKKAPICGRICMDQFMVNVTDIPDVRPMDPVTLIGRDGDEEITMEQLGELSGRFNYEFACLITDRVPRIYVNSAL